MEDLKMGIKAKAVAFGAMAASLLISSSAQAALTLTAAAIADGFSLTRFYFDPGVTYGQLGMTNTANGQIIGAGYARNQLALFNNVDGQTPASALLTVAFPGTPTSIATVGTNTYVNRLGGSALNSGYYSVNQTTLASTALNLDLNFAAGYGLWANPLDGHLLATGISSGIYDIDPVTGHVRTVTNDGTFFDGVSVSPDGLVVYGAALNAGSIRGFDIATGAPVLNVGLGGRGPDGTGVISGSAFNGQIVVDNNDGTLGLIDPLTSTLRIIATGGTRGDLVGPDRSTGSLLLSQSEGVFRLSIAGGAIGGGPVGGAIPEPTTWALMILGFGAVGATLRRRRVAVLSA
jgi:hypothetical protein